jgi:S-adenosylmethionine:tRNA ribosyltransferase-isomerase
MQPKQSVNSGMGRGTNRDSIIRGVLVSEFAYNLPEELIAQEPLADRASSRMLHLERSSGRSHDRQFRDFANLLAPDDLVIFNNTRVFPARLEGKRSPGRAGPTGPNRPPSGDLLKGKVEVLLTRQVSEDSAEWECLVRPGRKIGVGEVLSFGDPDENGKVELLAEVIARGPFGERRIRFEAGQRLFEVLERIGHVPLPPYIRRADDSRDRDRYQTVYARERGSVAVPTAGLHFTPEILSAMKERGIETAEITLHVGLGTFQPVRVDRVEDHRLHSEAYSISEAAASKINRALEQKRRVVAIGTTTVRTLEYAARHESVCRVQAGRGEADIFIYPGYRFRVVGALLTNFHLPESTLLMLVCAFGGKGSVLGAYQHAVNSAYRFYSYGDCMLLE